MSFARNEPVFAIEVFREVLDRTLVESGFGLRRCHRQP